MNAVFLVASAATARGLCRRLRTPLSRALYCATLLLAAVGLALGTACGRHAYGVHELEESTLYYYNDLRWSRLSSAALRMHPDLRGAFVADWTKRLAEVELQDIEVIDMRQDLEHDAAEVSLAFSWVDRQSMQLRSATVTQRWLRTDKGWIAGSHLELPGAP
ncbi:MAG: hypothetical protein ACO3JL_19675 [Myxococcota bacterium]